MLREEVEKYTKLTGEDGWNIPIIKIGSYLDGYDKGIEILDKIRAEIVKLDDVNPDYPIDMTVHISRYEVLKIIDKYRVGSEEEQ